MATRTEQSYNRPIAIAVIEGATTPNPGTVNAVALSTLTGGWMRWTGTQWVPVHHAPHGTLAILTAQVATGSIAADNVILSAKIPAGLCRTGQLFRYSLYGFSGLLGVALTFRLRAGTTGTTSDATAWTSITSAAQLLGARAGYDGFATLRAAGGSGILFADGKGFGGTNTLPTNTAVEVAVNTNADWYLSLCVTATLGAFNVGHASIEAA